MDLISVLSFITALTPCAFSIQLLLVNYCIVLFVLAVWVIFGLGEGLRRFARVLSAFVSVIPRLVVLSPDTARLLFS